MDWQAAEDGLKAWVVAMSMISPDLVAWDSQPVGMRLYPQVDLRLFDHRGRDGMGAEITYGEPNDVGQMYPVASQQRTCSWSITVTTRDQRANQKAYVVLDQMAVMLELPYTTERLGSLGLVLLDMGRVIPNSDVPSEHRDLSQAVLTLQLGYVTEVTVPPGVTGVAIDIIEHTEIGGTVLDADATTPVGVETKIIPPLA